MATTEGEAPEFVCNERRFGVDLALGANQVVLMLNYAKTASFTFRNGVEIITAATIEIAVDYDQDNETPLWGPAVAYADLLLAANGRVQMNLVEMVALAFRVTLTVGGASTIDIVGKG